MAYYRKTICSAPGCTNYAESGCIYCSEHKKQYIKRGTTSEHPEYYKTAWWTKHRKAFLLSHIWCEECLKQDKHTLATTVHHTHGYGDWQSFCDVSKWQALCSTCHSRIHTTVTNEQLWDKYGGKDNEI